MKIHSNAFVLLIALLILGCEDTKNSKDKSSGVIKEGSGKLPKVEVVTPQEREFSRTIKIVGDARPNQVVELRALENGAVKSIKKDIGDRVKAGEVLAVLENPQINRDFNVLRAKLQAARSNYERLNSIYEKTPALTSLSQVESARADYESTLAEFNASKEQVNFLQIRSPFRGIVTERNVDKGATVQSGISNPGTTPLFEVMDTEIIRVKVPLPEADVRYIKEGAGVTIKFPELADTLYSARVSRIAGALDSQSKSMNLEIDIDNKDLKIKPGMYAQTSFEVESRKNMLSLPNTALAIRDGKTFLYVVTPQNRVQLQEVKVGLQNKNYFELLSKDMDSSSLVIISGKRQVDNGMLVEPNKK